jgi:hypothetical protein
MSNPGCPFKKNETFTEFAFAREPSHQIKQRCKSTRFTWSSHTRRLRDAREFLLWLNKIARISELPAQLLGTLIQGQECMLCHSCHLLATLNRKSRSKLKAYSINPCTALASKSGRCSSAYAAWVLPHSQGLPSFQTLLCHQLCLLVLALERPCSASAPRDRYRLNHYRHRCLLLRAMQEHDLRQISYTLSRRQFRP